MSNVYQGTCFKLMEFVISEILTVTNNLKSKFYKSRELNSKNVTKICECRE